MALLGGLLAKKFVFGTISTFLYGGGGGSVAYGVAGLGTEIDSLSDTEVEVDETVRVERKALRAKRTVGSSDRMSMRNDPVDKGIDAATNLPNGFVSSQMYQMESSTDFENNDQKYYCSNIILSDRVKWEEKKNERKNDVKIDAKGNYGRMGYLYGCVNVLGHKDYYDDGKGRGSGKFQYTLVTYDYTVILVNTVDADDGKLMIDGVSYIFKREFNEENNQQNKEHKGVVSGQKPQERQELTEANKEKLLVAPGMALGHKQDDGGFNFKNDKVCKQGECYGDSIKTEYSNRIGKSEFNKSDTRKDVEGVEGKLGGAYEGTNNFDKLTDAGGMFEGLKKEIQRQYMRGYYRLDVNNNGVREKQAAK